MVSGCESFTSSSMFPSCINWLGIIMLLTSRFWEYVAMSSLDVHFCWNWLAPACRAKPILGREPWIPSQNDLWWRPVSHCGKGPHSVADHRSDPIPLSTELLWLLLYGIAIILDWCHNCFTALFVSGLSFGMYINLSASHSIVHDPLAKARRNDRHWQMADLEPIRAFLRSERDRGAFTPVFDGGLDP